jgi:hypothetical protein
MIFVRTCLVLLSVSLTASASITNDLPRFEELYKLLRQNLGGVNASELDQAAVKGLIRELQPQALLGVEGANSVASSPIGLARTRLYDNSYIYFGVNSISEDLGEKMMAAYHDIAATNKAKLKGVVLDLRFANGSNYSAAAKVADVFFNNEQPLLDWGTESVHATKKRNAITVPVALLVNHQTSGAAEALAAVLRDTNAGLLIGSSTAGHASVYKSFPLTSGEKLQIATAQIKVANKKVLSGALKPDIAINVSAEDEKTWLSDPYKQLHKPETAKETDVDSIAGDGTSNAPIRRRINEAELLRQQREGIDSDDTTEDRAKARTDTTPVLSDPVLLRGLDLLKGLSVVQQQRPS